MAETTREPRAWWGRPWIWGACAASFDRLWLAGLAGTPGGGGALRWIHVHGWITAPILEAFRPDPRTLPQLGAMQAIQQQQVMGELFALYIAIGAVFIGVSALAWWVLRIFRQDGGGGVPASPWLRPPRSGWMGAGLWLVLGSALAFWPHAAVMPAYMTDPRLPEATRQKMAEVMAQHGRSYAEAVSTWLLHTLALAVGLAVASVQRRRYAAAVLPGLAAGAPVPPPPPPRPLAPGWPRGWIYGLSAALVLVFIGAALYINHPSAEAMPQTRTSGTTVQAGMDQLASAQATATAGKAAQDARAQAEALSVAAMAAADPLPPDYGAGEQPGLHAGNNLRVGAMPTPVAMEHGGGIYGGAVRNNEPHWPKHADVDAWIGAYEAASPSVQVLPYVMPLAVEEAPAGHAKGAKKILVTRAMGALLSEIVSFHLNQSGGDRDYACFSGKEEVEGALYNPGMATPQRWPQSGTLPVVYGLLRPKGKGWDLVLHLRSMDGATRARTRHFAHGTLHTAPAWMEGEIRRWARAPLPDEAPDAVVEDDLSLARLAHAMDIGDSWSPYLVALHYPDSTYLHYLAATELGEQAAGLPWADPDAYPEPGLAAWRVSRLAYLNRQDEALQMGLAALRNAPLDLALLREVTRVLRSKQQAVFPDRLWKKALALSLGDPGLQRWAAEDEGGICWDIRGSAYVDDTRPEALRQMQPYLDRSLEWYQQSLASAPWYPGSLYGCLQQLYAQGDREEADRLLAGRPDAVKDPDVVGILLNFNRPRWGGDIVTMLDLIGPLAERHPLLWENFFDEGDELAKVQPAALTKTQRRLLKEARRMADPASSYVPRYMDLLANPNRVEAGPRLTLSAYAYEKFNYHSQDALADINCTLAGLTGAARSMDPDLLARNWITFAYAYSFLLARYAGIKINQPGPFERFPMAVEWLKSPPVQRGLKPALDRALNNKDLDPPTAAELAIVEARLGNRKAVARAVKQIGENWNADNFRNHGRTGDGFEDFRRDPIAWVSPSYEGNALAAAMANAARSASAVTLTAQP
jgi:hypothetical protein